MLESSASSSPPSLHYSPVAGDLDQSSTRDSTPVTTPLTRSRPDTTPSHHHHHHHHQDSSDPFWSSRTLAPRPSSFDLQNSESSHFHDDFPLFPSLSSSSSKMTGPAVPIDIATRQTSVSPPGQQASNLTSALQKANNGERTGSVSHNNSVGLSVFKAPPSRKDSVTTSAAQWGNGTMPISVSGSNRDKPRRESLAGSLVGGMSWGGVSVGSWIRDE